VMSKPPRWNSERFEAWTNAQLDAMEMYAPPRDPFHSFDPSFATVEKAFSTHLRRGRVIEAARAKDVTTVERLADAPELQRLALREALRQHRPGREKGEPRPRDLPQLTKWCCEDALADVKHIRGIWKETYPKDYRGSTPLAMEFAARRWGIDPPEVLINFKKNRHRNQRRS
jgi:hypothetical protein